MDIIRYLEAIRQVPTLSGFEDKGQEKLLHELSPLFDESRRAGVSGLLFVNRCGIKGAPLLLVDAHLDEIGLIVTDIDKSGLLAVSRLGGMDPRTLTAARFTVHADEDLTAVSVKKPFVVGGPEARKLPSYDKFRLFTGYKKDELSEKGVRVGTPISMTRTTEALGTKQVCGPYMDDKSCAVIGLAAAEMIKNEKIACDFALLLSSQEESYGAGFGTGVFDAKPDEILVIDVDFGATPEVDGSKAGKLGGGPTVEISIETDRRLTRDLLDVAKEKEIPVQPLMSVKHTGTNASDAPFLMGGIPTAVIGLPLKYMHTSVETLHTDDIEYSAKLVAAYAAKRFGQIEEAKGGCAQ